MANINRGEVLATVDGQKFTLKFDANSLAELEMKLDIRIGAEPAGKNDPFAKGLLAGTRALLWAALLHDHPTLSIQEVGLLLTPLTKKPDEFRELRRALVTAYAAAWPDPEPEKQESESDSKNAPGLDAGIGESSLSRQPESV